ncbi:MAG: hypothetical protein WAW03_20120 [Anaerolineae bacterium]
MREDHLGIGRSGSATGTAQAVLDYAQPAARLIGAGARRRSRAGS